MKRLLTLLPAGVLALAFAAPAFAQTRNFNGFLDHHPGVARDLNSNPQLLYDPRFRAAHPELQAWLDGHPSEWRGMKYQGMGGPVAPGYAPAVYHHWPAGYGAWDDDHVWRDPDWWQDHHPDWCRMHHPEWAEWRRSHWKEFEHHEEKLEHHEEKAEQHAWHEQEKAEKWEQHHDH